MRAVVGARRKRENPLFSHHRLRFFPFSSIDVFFFFFDASVFFLSLFRCLFLLSTNHALCACSRRCRRRARLAARVFVVERAKRQRATKEKKKNLLSSLPSVVEEKKKDAFEKKKNSILSRLFVFFSLARAPLPSLIHSPNKKNRPPWATRPSARSPAERESASAPSRGPAPRSSRSSRRPRTRILRPTR